MPQPIYNIIFAAGLDPEKIEFIENTEINVNRIREALRKKWEDRDISDQDICDDLIDYREAPEWIKKAIEEERCAIQNDIKKAVKKKLNP